MSQSVELKAVKAVRKSKTAKAVAEPVVAEPVVAKPVVAEPAVAEPTPEELEKLWKNRETLVRLRLTTENTRQYIGDSVLFRSRGGQKYLKEIKGVIEKFIKIDHPDLKNELGLRREIYVVPKKIVAPAVAKPVVAPAVAEPVKPASKAVKRIKIKSLPVVEEPVKKNHWMTSASRIKKVQPMAIIWENVEDISDDENDTPQAAGKRLSTMKATRDQIRRRAYRSKVAELQFAGLFLNWEEQEPLQTCPREYMCAKRSSKQSSNKRVSTVMYP